MLYIAYWKLYKLDFLISFDKRIEIQNTPGTAGGPGPAFFRKEIFFFLYISSSYAKISGKQIFSLGSFPEVGQKQKTENGEKERPKVGNNNGQLGIATPPRVAHTKLPGPKRKKERKTERL